MLILLLMEEYILGNARRFVEIIQELGKIKKKSDKIKIKVTSKSKTNFVNFYLDKFVYKVKFEVDSFDQRLLCYLKEKKKIGKNNKEDATKVSIIAPSDLSIEGTVLPFAIEKYKRII